MAKRAKKKKISPQAVSSKPTLPSGPTEIAEIRPSKSEMISWKALLQAAVIIAAGLWIYWPALHGDWLWDDEVLITGNLNLHSLEGLRNLWFSNPAIDYWPLTWTLLWIEWHLWGDVSLGYHLCSLVLHISSGFLIWRLFHRLGLRNGWLGGLLFVIHPLAVESVAWISEIKNTLSLPLFLLSCNAWLDAEEGKRHGYWRSIAYYLAAMLAKTSTVMLPAVLLLYCWWKRGRVTRQELQRLIPYGAIALVLGLVTIYFQNVGHDPNALEPVGFVTRSIGAGTALFFYLGKFILPVDLLPIYPRWTLDPPSILQVLTLPVLAAMLFGLWTQRKGWGRHALFGFGFFLLNVLPVLGLVNMSYLNISRVADHLVYVSIIGLVGLVISALGQLQARTPSISRYAIGAVAIGMTWLTWESHNYASLFVNEETLWTYELQHNSQAWNAYNSLGNVSLQKGRISEAVEQFEQALKINPDYADAHNNLGNALLQQGRTQAARVQFEQALKLSSDVHVRSNLGNALLQMGRVSEAVEQYEHLLNIDPNDPNAHYNLGAALLQTDRVPEAIEQFEKALNIKPDYAEAHCDLGVALLQIGRASESLEQFEQALKINPDYADAHYNLGNALAQTGRAPEAIEQYQLALKLKPDYADAHYNLGNALAQTGRASEAIEQYQLALKLKPDYAEVHGNWGTVLLQTGHLSEAIYQYEQALELKPDNAETHNNLGVALLQTAHAPEATEQFEQALKLKPDYAEAHNNLGETLLQTGHVPEAVEQFEQALKINPGYAPARKNLARAQALPKTGSTKK